MNFPHIDTTTWFYKNCKRQRRNKAKICQVCPFRAGIEHQEHPTLEGHLDDVLKRIRDDEIEDSR